MAGIGRGLRPDRAVRNSTTALVAVVLAALTGVSACSLGGQPAPVVIALAIESGIDGKPLQPGDPFLKTLDAFHRANPDVRVDLLYMSPTTDIALQQVSVRFGAGVSDPDVVQADIAWIATLAEKGWILPLDGFRPRKSDFFGAWIESATIRRQLYALPWFIDAEGLYYRTDLVRRPPTTPGEVVQAAIEASRRPGIKYGLAFEGKQYEGLVTAFIDFGGTLDFRHLDTPANEGVLTYMHDLIYVNGVAPPAVTSWQEDNVRDIYVGGQAAFAVNWPYVYQAAEDPKSKSNSAVRGQTAWIPFPAVEGRTAQAAVGGWDLAINARSRHRDAAYRLIEYLVRPDVQIDRAVNVGSVPSVKAAYTKQLYTRAPWFRSEKLVFDAATPRPINPRYPQESSLLQAQLERVLQNQASPQVALMTAQQQVDQLPAGP